MLKTFASLLLGLSVLGAASLYAADTAPATKPAAPACCDDTCKKMGTCCTADDKGKVSCPMGGGCCLKPETQQAH